MTTTKKQNICCKKIQQKGLLRCKKDQTKIRKLKEIEQYD